MAKSSAKAKQAPKDTEADDEEHFDDETPEGDGDEGVNDTYDLEDVDENAETTFEAAPPGKYPCTLFEAEFGKSTKGNAMVTWIFQVATGEYEGRRFWYHTTLAAGGLARLKKLVMRLDPEQKAVSLKGFKMSTDPQKLVGFPALVEVKTRYYKGKLSNNVVDVEAMPEEGSDFFD